MRKFSDKRRKRRVKKILWVTETAGGNYVKKVRESIEMPTQGVHHVSILHDDWCGIFNGEACNCDPDIIPWSNDPWD